MLVSGSCDILKCGSVFLLNLQTTRFIKYCDTRYYCKVTCQKQNILNSYSGESAMRGTLILVVFFVLFTSASLLIPSPMFPGNVFCILIGEAISQNIEYLSGLFNGVFYALVLWLVFVGISRRLEQEKK